MELQRGPRVAARDRQRPPAHVQARRRTPPRWMHPVPRIAAPPSSAWRDPPAWRRAYAAAPARAAPTGAARCRLARPASTAAQRATAIAAGSMAAGRLASRDAAAWGCKAALKRRRQWFGHWLPHRCVRQRTIARPDGRSVAAAPPPDRGNPGAVHAPGYRPITGAGSAYRRYRYRDLDAVAGMRVGARAVGAAVVLVRHVVTDDLLAYRTFKHPFAYAAVRCTRT